MEAHNQAAQFSGENAERQNDEEIVRALRTVMMPGEVTEIRALNAVTDDRQRPHVESGYFDFDHIGAVPDQLRRLRSASGIYFTPNPVNPQLLARAANRLQPAERGSTTSDGDIAKRRYLLVDLDPVRASGVSSTVEEHAAAEELGRDIEAVLQAEGWPQPLMADSGNGVHLMFAVNLPTIDNKLVERVLQALSKRFDNERVKVDRSVSNPARIWKLYGTLSCKGANTPERPHRFARIISAPERLEPVATEMLETMAASLPAAPRAPRAPHREGQEFDIEGWVARHRLVERFGLGELEDWRPADGGQGKRRVFRTCPWNPEHTNSSAYLIRFQDGAIAAGCHHDSCGDKDWHALRDVVEPGWREEEDARGGNVRPRPADILVGLAREARVELFHTPGCDGDGYVGIPVENHVEVYALKSQHFRRWLSRLYFVNTGTSPTNQSLDDALNVLTGIALYDGAEHEVFVRIAEHEGRISIDLGDASWQAVEVGPEGWKVGASSVKFVRPRGLQPLPVPERGGCVDEWRELVNVPDDDQWALLLTATLAMLRPGRPHPILLVQGEQGSAKTTLCRQIRALVDPNTAPLRAEPREVRDLVIAAKNSHLQAYDNLSSLRIWLADGLCRMATGGGFATRQLYADDAETIIDVMRPVMINGIDEVSTRSDFLDRAVTLTLPSIGRGKRRTEEDVEAEFERRRPRIFGSLLTAMSAGLRKLPEVRIEELPRMADFAKFGVAAEAGLGLPEGSFLRAYEENRRGTHEVALDASPIVPFIMDIMEMRDEWTGPSRELLQMLENRLGVDGQRRRARGWPETPKQLTSTLKRIATNLRASGFEVTFGGHGRAGIEITIAWIDPSSRPFAATPHLRSAPFPAQFVSPGMSGIAAVAV